MTDREWKALEDALKEAPYVVRNIQCDNLKVGLVFMPIKGNRYGFVLLTQDIRARRPVKKCVYSAKIKRGLTKRQMATWKKIGIDLAERYDTDTYYWNSVASMRRHFEKTFASIEALDLPDWALRPPTGQEAEAAHA